MAVTLPPEPQPLTSLGRDEFDDAMFALIAWLYVMVPEFEAAILALDANDVRGTSTTSFTPNASGLGSKAFATQSGKSWLPGMWVTGGYTSDGKEYWAGVVESYSASTLTVNVKVVSNHDTARSSWQISMSPPVTDLLEDNSVIVHSGNGYGSTNTKIRRFTTVQENLGSSITYADSAANGASFTINQTGVYAIYYQDKGQDVHAVTRNANGASNPSINNTSETLAASSTTGTNVKSVSRVAKLNSGDVVRAHTNGISVENGCKRVVLNPEAVVMPYLLVNSPSGRQEIIEIGSTGNYFDIARVIWDERTDGPMPAVTLGKMQRSGDSLVTLEDYTAEHLSATLAAAKATKLLELKAAYDADNYADIDHNSKTWHADKDAQQLLAAVLSVGSVPGGMYWRDVTETQNAMTFSDLQALAGAILTRGLAIDSNLDTKKAAVAAATTVGEVDAITW